jgi:predicted ATPase
VRLATVVAPEGMGKTRFAIEAARRLADDFPDGVWCASSQ